MTDDLGGRIDTLMVGARADLEALVRIPSVSAEGFDPAKVRASAEASATMLEAAGFEDVGLLEVEGAHPAVLARADGPPGAPRILLYAHHDVQPQGAENEWDSPPFEPTERNGRLYGRGSCDDKVGIVAHATAFRAHGGDPPVGVTVFVEGEEEIGSPTLVPFLERYRDALSSDVIVLADSSNWDLGVPALTTSLRGLVDCEVEVRTLDHALHSGMYGGPIPDALTVLARLLATLHDERGNVAVPGLVTGPADPLDLTEERLRAEAGVIEGLQLIGEGALTERLWTRPAISVLAIDAPPVAKASNTLIPEARAKVSLRIAPGDDPARAMDALVAHLEANVPWGAWLRVERGAAGHPYAIHAEGPAYDAARSAFQEAWGTPPVDIGAGGTIPFISAFAEAFPSASILVTGVEDPDGRAHGANESVHLGEFRRTCLAEALLLSRLGA